MRLQLSRDIQVATELRQSGSHRGLVSTDCLFHESGQQMSLPWNWLQMNTFLAKEHCCSISHPGTFAVDLYSLRFSKRAHPSFQTEVPQFSPDRVSGVDLRLSMLAGHLQMITFINDFRKLSFKVACGVNPFCLINLNASPLGENVDF